jgi:hypothetical protein
MVKLSLMRSPAPGVVQIEAQDHLVSIATIRTNISLPD